MFHSLKLLTYLFIILAASRNRPVVSYLFIISAASRTSQLCPTYLFKQPLGPMYSSAPLGPASDALFIHHHLEDPPLVPYLFIITTRTGHWCPIYLSSPRGPTTGALFILKQPLGPTTGALFIHQHL